MIEQTLFDLGPQFKGVTYEPIKDEARLAKHLQKVYDLMKDGRWRTLREISDAVGCSESSASARLRDLTRDWAGGHTKEKKRSEYSDGVYLYRIHD